MDRSVVNEGARHGRRSIPGYVGNIPQHYD
jgi:hypothetical protein